LLFFIGLAAADLLIYYGYHIFQRELLWLALALPQWLFAIGMVMGEKQSANLWWIVLLFNVITNL
jgi:hypothetical protein